MKTQDEKRQGVTDAGIAVVKSCWFICGLDLVLAMFLVPVGMGLITGWVDGGNFRTVPDGCFGLLFVIIGSWSLYTAVRLLIEQDSTRSALGGRRHHISAAMSVVIVLFLWLAVLLDYTIYSSHVFEMGLGAVIFATIIFGSVGGLLIMISRQMNNVAGERVNEPTR